MLVRQATTAPSCPGMKMSAETLMQRWERAHTESGRKSFGAYRDRVMALMKHMHADSVEDSISNPHAPAAIVTRWGDTKFNAHKDVINAIVDLCNMVPDAVVHDVKRSWESLRDAYRACPENGAARAYATSLVRGGDHILEDIAERETDPVDDLGGVKSSHGETRTEGGGVVGKGTETHDDLLQTMFDSVIRDPSLLLGDLSVHRAKPLRPPHGPPHGPDGATGDPERGNDTPESGPCLTGTATMAPAMSRTAKKNAKKRLRKKLQRQFRAHPNSELQGAVERFRKACVNESAPSQVQREGDTESDLVQFNSVKWAFMRDCWNDNVVDYTGLAGRVVVFDRNAGDAFAEVLDICLEGCGGHDSVTRLVNARRPVRKGTSPFVSTQVALPGGDGVFNLTRVMTSRPDKTWKQNSVKFDPVSVRSDSTARTITGAKAVAGEMRRLRIPNPAMNDLSFLSLIGSMDVDTLLQDYALPVFESLNEAVRVWRESSQYDANACDGGDLRGISIISAAAPDKVRGMARVHALRRILADASAYLDHLRPGRSLELDSRRRIVYACHDLHDVRAPSGEPVARTSVGSLRCADAACCALALRIAFSVNRVPGHNSALIVVRSLGGTDSIDETALHRVLHRAISREARITFAIVRSGDGDDDDGNTDERRVHAHDCVRVRASHLEADEYNVTLR